MAYKYAVVYYTDDRKNSLVVTVDKIFHDKNGKKKVDLQRQKYTGKRLYIKYKGVPDNECSECELVDGELMCEWNVEGTVIDCFGKH